MKSEETHRAIFFDTNILAYAFDESDEKRRKSCAELVRAGFQGDISSSVSNQILCELFVVLTKHIGKPLSREKAAIIVGGLVDSSKWDKVNYTHSTVKRAMQDLQSINTSFWYVLIAETMRESGIRKIYTENEKDFRKIPWIEVKNPL